jgi:hypothetical protein
MILQWLFVGIIAFSAAAYLARRAWRTWFAPKGSCGGGCSCAGKATGGAENDASRTLIPLDQLVLRRREPNSPH